jgi:hypothetical protein
LDAEGGQFLEDFAGHQLITRGFLRREIFYYCSQVGSFEVLNRGFQLERGFKKLCEGIFGKGVRFRWVRLEYRGKVIGEGLRFISIGSCPCSLCNPNWYRSLSVCFKSFCSFPQGVISGGRGGKTVEEPLDVVIFVFMKELFKLLRSPVE